MSKSRVIPKETRKLEESGRITTDKRVTTDEQTKGKHR